jgi:hypothetical protein
VARKLHQNNLKVTLIFYEDEKANALAFETAIETLLIDRETKSKC